MEPRFWIGSKRESAWQTYPTTPTLPDAQNGARALSAEMQRHDLQLLAQCAPGVRPQAVSRQPCRRPLRNELLVQLSLSIDEQSGYQPPERCHVLLHELAPTTPAICMYLMLQRNPWIRTLRLYILGQRSRFRQPHRRYQPHNTKFRRPRCPHYTILLAPISAFKILSHVRISLTQVSV